MRIANSVALKLPVYNESGRFPFLWDELRLPLPKGADIDTVRAVLLGAAADASSEHVAPARHALRMMSRDAILAPADSRPTVRFEFGLDGLQCTVRYVTTATRRLDVRDRLTTLLLRDESHARLLGLERP